MQQQIIDIAQRKLKELRKKYSGFITVILDDWRGFRFIFDTKDVRQCNNDCKNCPLYQLLKNEKKDTFSTGLYPANPKDKSLFGPQNFLNCKTLSQYKDCYVNFLIHETNTEKEILEELTLIQNLKIIFSEGNDSAKLEDSFKQEIIDKTLCLADEEKKKKIRTALAFLRQ